MHTIAMSIATLLQAAEYLDRRERPAVGLEHGYASSLPAPAHARRRLSPSSLSCSSPPSFGARSLPSSLYAHESRHRRSQHKRAKKSQGSRTTHNELEKNRRAHLRTCLEKLKDMVPLGPEASKHTTLGLLTKAKRFIKSLEERDKRHSILKEKLAREQRFLRRRLEQLEVRNRESGVISRPLRRRLDSHVSVPQLINPILFTGHTSLSRRSLSECSSISTSSGTASRSDLPDSEPASISESDEVDVIGYGYTSNQSDTDDHSSIQSGSGDSGVALSASHLSLAHMEII